MSKKNYPIVKMCYLSEFQGKYFDKERESLGWPDDAKFLRKIINEGLKKKYKFTLH